MLDLMAVAYVFMIVLGLWRIFALRGREASQRPDILRSFGLPLGLAFLLAIALAFPFLRGYPEDIGFPLALRRGYVLAGHVTYATCGAALFYFLTTSRYRDEIHQVKWSLAVLFVVATCILGTTVLGALYDKVFAGFYFNWDRPHTTRLVLFWACALSYLLAFVRTFPHSSGSARRLYWAAPLVLAAGIALKVFAAIVPDGSMDALTWL